MANTLKFGNGQWATKVGSTLAFNDEGGNFKPLPFNFTRSTGGTRVNKDGLIEVITNNKPRIDFKDDSNGALLLEPLRNNYIPYSTLDFNGGSSPQGWSIGFGTGTYSYEQLEYKGQKAVKQTQITTGRSYLDTGSISILADTEHTLKVQFILDECVADDDDIIATFIGFGNDGSYRFSDIDANGVLEIQYNPLSDNVGNLRIGLGCGGNEDGGKSLAWAIPQLEAGSYATSYIPTQGAISTRVVESFTTSLPDIASFNSSNGFSVISKFGIGNAGSGTSAPFISFNDDTSNTYIGFGSNSSNFRCRLNLNGVAYLNTQDNAQRTQENSLFVSCDANGWSQGANGVTNYTGNNDASIYNKLSNITYISAEVYGVIKIKELSVYNTRLTDQELINLTTI